VGGQIGIRLKRSDQAAPQSRSEKITTKDTKDTKEHEGNE